MATNIKWFQRRDLFCACILVSGCVHALSLSGNLRRCAGGPPTMFTTSFGHLDLLFYCVHDVAAFFYSRAQWATLLIHRGWRHCTCCNCLYFSLRIGERWREIRPRTARGTASQYLAYSKTVQEKRQDWNLCRVFVTAVLFRPSRLPVKYTASLQLPCIVEGKCGSLAADTLLLLSGLILYRGHATVAPPRIVLLFGSGGGGYVVWCPLSAADPFVAFCIC